MPEGNMRMNPLIIVSAGIPTPIEVSRGDGEVNQT
jgi:hypothetical protein